MKKIFFLVYLLCVSITVKAQYSGLGTDSVSAETLKKYAPPALNPVMANKLKKMLDVTSPGMGALSPDKKTLYFSWRVTGISQVWKIEGPKSFPIQLTSGNDAVNISDIAPNGKFLIVSKDLNGQENPGLFKLDLITGQLEELFRKPKVQGQFGFLTDDSKYMYFMANDKSPDSYNTYKMNLQDKSVELVYEGKGNWYIADYRNQGAQLLMVKYHGNKQNEYYEYDVATKKLIPIIGQNEKEEYEVAYSAKPNEYLVLSNKTTDLKKLYVLKQGELKPISREIENEISSFSIDKNKKRILIEVNKEGYSEIAVLDAKTYRLLPAPKFPLGAVRAEQVFSGMTTKDSSVTMFGIITSKAPRVAYSYNWNTKKLTQWVVPSAPEVNLSSFAQTELASYKAKDGTTIPMFVRFPNNCKPTAAKRENCNIVVHFHGGPEAQTQPGFSSVAQAFVDEGFIFAEPNVRGSDGYGKKWVNLDNGPLRENVITDIEDASRWMKSNWKNSDGSTPKVGIMGWSYGGYSAFMGMTRFAGSYDAGVALVGMSNLVTFLNNTAPYRRILRISEYGDPEKDKEALLKLSAVTYVDRIKAPLMIIQGANDPRVPVGEAVQIHETLNKKNIPSTLIVFADEGHGSSKKENQVLEIGHAIEFFKKHLK